MSTALSVWWTLLCAVSVVNVVALAYSTRVFWLKSGAIPPAIYASRRLQLLCSAVYVLGCAFRSALPVFDVQRVCLVDSWLSSVMVGRSVATIAELCFVAQWALLMYEISQATHNKLVRLAALLVVPLIAVAETCSWYSVLTTSNLGHVIEESLWGLAATLLVVSLLSLYRRCSARLRPILKGMCLIGAAYVAFMFLIDVPMYWARWVADEAQGRHYLSLAQGLLDASGHWQVSYQWHVWKSEVVWMTLYFSIAVWLSIALVHTPAMQPSPVTARSS